MITSHSTPTRMAIVGAGIMGERMLRAALDHAADVVTITAIWDESPTALARIGAAFPGVQQSSSAAAAIDAADCVYIATPPATHIAYCEQVFAADRAVFVEKPLATDVDFAGAFVSRAAGERAAVNFPFASSMAVERLQQWIADAGGLPATARVEIDVAFATWPRPWQQAAAAWLDAPAEGGFTREVVSHFLFLARRMLGPLQLVSARVDRPEGRTENAIAAQLTAGTVPVHLTGAVGTTAADDHNTWTVRGGPAVRLRDWSWAEREGPDGSWTPDPDAAPNEIMRPIVLRRQLEGVAQMTRGEPHHLATLQEALEVQTIVEAILGTPSR